MASRFLFRDALWAELESRVPNAGAVRAAVAYVGSGGSALLPLRRGDTLVVDMSLRAVRSGVTDPNEIKKYLRRGVNVYSRGSLHAKFFIIDDVLIAGSSNVSRHAKETLDEAAVLTEDGDAVARAAAVFEQLCTEPVRKDYLQKCIDEYRPPEFSFSQGTSKRSAKVKVGKLWFIAGLTYRYTPEREKEAEAATLSKVERRLLDFEKSEVHAVRHPSPLKYFEQIREGDWGIICVEDGRGFEVWPPARFLGVERYPRGRNKFRYLLCFEQPTDGEPIRWSELRRAAPSSIDATRSSTPRTRPIASDADADEILGLWNGQGKFKAKGRPGRMSS